MASILGDSALGGAGCIERDKEEGWTDAAMRLRSRKSMCSSLPVWLPVLQTLCCQVWRRPPCVECVNELAKFISILKAAFFGGICTWRNYKLWNFSFSRRRVWRLDDGVDRRFRCAYCLYHHRAVWGSTHFWNVGILEDYMALHPRWLLYSKYKLICLPNKLMVYFLLNLLVTRCIYERLMLQRSINWWCYVTSNDVGWLCNTVMKQWITEEIAEAY
jgi:hypothetical protein